MDEILRGDIYWVKPIEGLLGGKIRPAVVVSNDKANKYSRKVTVVYLTSCEDVRYMPTHCNVKAMEESVALCESATTISKDRLESFIRTATDAEMEDVNRCLMIALGLQDSTAEPEEEREETVSSSVTIDRILKICDGMYMTEANNDKAEGIESVARMIRGKLRKELIGGE